MSLKIAQKGGIQITAPQENSAVFTAMQYADPDRNAFNLSKQVHGSMKFGLIYPIYSKMLMAGDSFKVKTSHFIRFAAVLSPILNKINITYASFFVPFRLVWKFWPTWISGGYNNDGVYTDESGNYLNQNDKYTSTPFTPQIPRILMSRQNNGDDFMYDFIDGGLADWLGYPTFPSTDDMAEIFDGSQAYAPIQTVNALPFMCYQKVIQDWFINPNIKDDTRIDALVPANVSGVLDDITPELTSLQYVNYGLDYFTSSLPYLQRGDTYSIETPNSKVEYSERAENGTVNYAKVKKLASDNTQSLQLAGTANNVWQNLSATIGNTGSGNTPILLDTSVGLSVTLQSSIQELRFLNAIQRWQEKSLRVGTRYIDFLKCFFGVKSSDKSLQRSEYLGAKVCDVTKEDINQTSETSADGTPLGTVASKIIGAGQGDYFNCYAEEHGMLFVMAYITPETIYKNRMPREFLYEDKEDFLFPEFTHLSPQAVYNAELFCPRNIAEGASTYVPKGVFGYQDRYNELRCDMNQVHGDFKGNLSFFLQMRNFSKMPALNTSFLKADDIDTSIFATDEVADKDGTKHKVDHIWASFDFDVKAVRTLPKISTPSLI